MSLAKSVRGAVARINRRTKSLQPKVTMIAYTGSDEYGSTKPPVIRSFTALVDEGVQPRTLPTGFTLMTRAYIAILQPIPPINNISGRTNPVDERDKFTLPNGTTAVVAAVRGFDDGETGRPFFHEIWLGMK